MSKILPEGLDGELAAWIEAQPVFFVGTAPSSGGHVNVSPKGYDTLRVLGPHRLAYRDLTGSTAESIAHLRDDGRIVLLWCGFDRAAKLVRVHGTGRVLLEGDEGHAELDAVLPPMRGSRSIIEVTADRVSTSCGYSIPRMGLVEERPTLKKWVDNKTDEQLETYRRRKNAVSIDGLPALADASDDAPSRATR
ncbi:pyridoxamine 5'-phosphate oxidase family protein [Egicoccus sp. AB-alg2]|uniref:pyridoxamine 5'-phosphate oxidase family protein n=1 Tax=Egicoccus sp. AB-alg2 TaxID=3242693 RepID=UPI00359EB1F0